jgi:hypothetical protein
MSKAQRIIAGSLLLFVLSLLVWRRADALRLSGAPEPNEQPFIKLDPTSGVVEVAGLSALHLAKLRQAGLSTADWAELFAVYTAPTLAERKSPAVGQAGILSHQQRSSDRGQDTILSHKEFADVPAMLGTYSVTEAALRFTPRFPLVAGLRYSARFNVAHWRERVGAPPLTIAPLLETTLTLAPVVANASTVVSAIYPSANELPANQLKLYLHFSAPMSVGEAYQRLHLLDDSGREVPRAFLRVEQELWDATRQRFTLLFDPGRVKRGLRSNLEDGVPLQPGQRYRLRIDADWRDGAGQPLRAAFEKAFTVTAPDRQSPVYTAWQLKAPAAGTTEPVQIRFDEALDHALLTEFLTVFDAQGQRLNGTIAIGADERHWLFTPIRPWRAGRYEVRVNPKLEDRAGNNLQRLFDADVPAQPGPETKPAEIILPLVITGQNASF